MTEETDRLHEHQKIPGHLHSPMWTRRKQLRAATISICRAPSRWLSKLNVKLLLSRHQSIDDLIHGPVFEQHTEESFG